MYFPGDPLLALDPIYQGIPESARERLVSRFSIDTTQEGYALGYEFDIVLRGPQQTPTEA
jgi:protocatechuate 3,4-dioxygenase beta subunit